MAILTFVLGTILFAAALGSLALSVDLVPTEMGRLYAESGVLFLCAAFIVWAIACMIFRLDSIVAPPKRRKSAPVAAPSGDAPAAAPAPTPDDDVNANRAGHLPSLREMEDALAEPEPDSKIIGRYTAGGANYVIYADGAIEAETEHGGMRFASMDELKAYIAGRKR